MKNRFPKPMAFESIRLCTITSKLYTQAGRLCTIQLASLLQVEYASTAVGMVGRVKKGLVRKRRGESYISRSGLPLASFLMPPPVRMRMPSMKPQREPMPKVSRVTKIWAMPMPV